MVLLRGPKRSRVDDRGLERRDVGVKLKGVRSGVERRRGRGLKARDPGRRDAPGKVIKERRAPRERGRMGTSVIVDADAADRMGWILFHLTRRKFIGRLKVGAIKC